MLDQVSGVGARLGALDVEPEVLANALDEAQEVAGALAGTRPMEDHALAVGALGVGLPAIRSALHRLAASCGSGRVAWRMPADVTISACAVTAGC